MLCRTVTRLRARREAAQAVAPTSTASEATSEATGPEAVTPTAQATEVAAERRAATPGPADAREEPLRVPAGDSTEDFSQHVSILSFFAISLRLYRVRASAPDGSSPRGYVRLLAVGHRLILATFECLREI